MKIAFLGLGAMGARIAHHLLAAGYSLTVYNRSAERTAPLVAAQARTAATPRSAVEGADVVMSMVRDDKASREVWLANETGAIHALRPRAVAIELSTLSPTWVETLGATIESSGGHFIDSPVIGSRPQAEARQLIALVGGEPTTVERVRPVLAAITSAIHHLGPIGSGSVMKLAVNTLFGIQVAAWAEMLAVLEQRGIAPAQAVELLNRLPTTSPALQGAGRLMASASYAPLFPIDLVTKDFGYALALAEETGVPSPLLAAAKRVYAKAVEDGYGGDNIVGVKQLYSK